MNHPSCSRRTFLATAAALAAGCGGSASEPDLVWGRRGVSPGDFVRPRAVTVTHNQHLYVVDFTARVQAYDGDGTFLGISWQTPDFRNGRPSGLSTATNGDVILSDSHYHCVRVYSPEGKEKLLLGGVPGNEPGQFGYVSDCVQDAVGNYYLSEFGANERITKLDADGKVVKVWGERGLGDGQFNHIRALAIGPDGLLYVADACNHRIHAFELNGKLAQTIGEHGTEPGRFAYPYDVAFGPYGDLYVVELGNHRVQKLTRDGQPLSHWGSPGRTPGKLYSPWALVVDARDRVHVIDSENHRVQRFRI